MILPWQDSIAENGLQVSTMDPHVARRQGQPSMRIHFTEPWMGIRDRRAKLGNRSDTRHQIIAGLLEFLQYAGIKLAARLHRCDADSPRWPLACGQSTQHSRHRLMHDPQMFQSHPCRPVPTTILQTPQAPDQHRHAQFTLLTILHQCLNKQALALKFRDESRGITESAFRPEQYPGHSKFPPWQTRSGLLQDHIFFLHRMDAPLLLANCKRLIRMILTWHDVETKQDTIKQEKPCAHLVPWPVVWTFWETDGRCW